AGSIPSSGSDAADTLKAALPDPLRIPASAAGGSSIHETPPTIAINNIAGDNIVSSAEAAADVIISGSTSGVEDGQTVHLTLLDSGNNVVATATTTVTGNAWSYTVAAGTIPASGSDGVYTVKAEVTDLAGNPASDTQGVTLDETAPTNGVDIVAIADDTGTASDFVTSDTTLTVSGTNGALGAGEKVQVSSDGVNWSDVVQDTTTSWHLDDPTVHGASFTYQAR